MDEQGGQNVAMAGWLLIACGALFILLMFQHPSRSDAGPVIQMVHGGLLALILLEFAALLFVTSRWLAALHGVIAAVLVGAGTFAGFGAGMINGFIVPAISRYEAGGMGTGISQFAWEANQALATVGVIAIGVGLAIWSLLLWREGRRKLAGAGWLSGLAPALLVASGLMEMDLHGALIAYVAQQLWIALLGWSVARG